MVGHYIFEFDPAAYDFAYLSHLIALHADAIKKIRQALPFIAIRIAREVFGKYNEEPRAPHCLPNICIMNHHYGIMYQEGEFL